ncbi:MAG: DUF6785 family protein [Planctomycetota bacterium]
MPSHTIEQDSAAQTGLTVRAVLIGFALVALNTVWSTFAEFYMRSSNMGTGLIPMSVFLPFFLMVGLVNVLWRVMDRILRGWGIDAPLLYPLLPQEMMCIFIIAFVGNAGCGMNWLVSVMGCPRYFATPENKWEETFFPYLASWAIPLDTEAVKWFYDGLPEGMKIPWNIWLQPLFWWVGFMVAGVIGSLCLSSILRRQWVDRERLNFALVDVPAEIVKNPDKPSLVPKIYTSRMFWFAFAITFGLVMWNVVGYFCPQFPEIGIIKARWQRILPYFPYLYQRINPYLVGFCFFCDVDILFSMWFFWLLGAIQCYIYDRLGVDIGRPSEYSSSWQLVNLQGCGGYIFLAFWALWIARRHLWDVVKKAWNPSAKDVDDSDEFMSHRTAVIGLALATAYVCFWLRALGIEWRYLLFYVGTSVVFAIGFGKMVAESGLVYFTGPFNDREFAEFALGYKDAHPGSLAGLAIAHGWGIFGVMWFTHVAKAIDYMKTKRRKLSFLLILVFTFSIVVGLWFVLYMGYTYGAYNSETWCYRSGPVYYYGKVKTKMTEPVGVDLPKMMLVGAGFLITAFMTFMRYQFTWWRLHPIGFTVATMWATRISVMTIFIVWFVKVTFLGLGGAKVTNRLRPLFLGILCGFAAGVFVSFLVDWAFFPFDGHPVHY